MDYMELVSLKYKNVDYNMYVDRFNRHYFLKKDVYGNLFYPEIEELIELAIKFVTIPNVMNVRNDGTRFSKLVPKVIVGGVAVTLTATLISGFLLSSNFKKKDEYDVPQIVTSVEQYLTDNSFIFENSNDVEIDTYTDQEYLRIKYVNDMAYLDKVIDIKDVSYDEMMQVISDNPNIAENFKKILFSFCDDLYRKYPNVDKRVLYENLKTIKIFEVDEYELLNKTFSADSCGCYIKDANEIYVKQGCDFQPGTWDYQVIYHELSHVLRIGIWERENETIKVDVEGPTYKNTVVMEALNSLFAVSLFDYEEKDIAYQLQSNYIKVILECLDNYKLDDYVNHSLSYFIAKLDEHTNSNDAVDMLNLMEVQYDDYHSEDIEISQDQYYRLYDYIAKIYFDKYIVSDMSYEEACEIKDTLLEKILYDVPDEYNIDVNHFDDILNEYCNELGISTYAKSK